MKPLPPTALYLITDGSMTAPPPSNATSANVDESSSARRVLELARAAVAARFAFIQIREKQLTARELYQLVRACAAITRGTPTRLLVNDRADIARAAGADGVQLTTHSLDAATVRRAFGADFIIGISTHSLAETQAARDGGADFALLGHIFPTPSKTGLGEPLGVEILQTITRNVAPFPVFALGGINLQNAPQIWRAGASGIAAIGILNSAVDLKKIADTLRQR